MSWLDLRVKEENLELLVVSVPATETSFPASLRSGHRPRGSGLVTKVLRRESMSAASGTGPLPDAETPARLPGL